jgi:hypothetical protein
LKLYILFYSKLHFDEEKKKKRVKKTSPFDREHKPPPPYGHLSCLPETWPKRTREPSLPKKKGHPLHFLGGRKIQPTTNPLSPSYNRRLLAKERTRTP